MSSHHLLIGTVALYHMEKLSEAEEHDFCQLAAPRGGATGGRSRRVDGCRGCRWPPGYKPCSLEPYRPMLRPDQCRFAAPECVRWLCGIGPRSPSTTRDAPDQRQRAHTPSAVDPEHGR